MLKNHFFCVKIIFRKFLIKISVLIETQHLYLKIIVAYMLLDAAHTAELHI